MGSVVLSLGMDVLVLLCMGWTIYFVLKLSKNLENFKRHRRDLEKLIQDLSKNIDDAQRAIHDLESASRRAGEPLQSVLEDAGAMSDELQLMVQSGENLARRLETLVDKRAYSSMAAPAQPEDIERPFAIHDHEFEALSGENESDSSAEENSREHEAMFPSRAERELFQALRSNKKAG